MQRFSANEFTTMRWSFDEDVRNYLQAGFDGIGVWRQKLADFGEEKGAELLADSGLPVTSLFWVGGFTGSDGRSFNESVADALEALQLAHFLGARNLVVHSGPRHGHTRNHSRRLLTDAIRAMLPLAEEFGVRLALEPMPTQCASGWTFLNSLEDARTFVDSMGSDYVRLVLDTYYFGDRPSLLEELESLIPYLAVVHVSDASESPAAEQRRRRIGDGHLPLALLVNTLHAKGFDGEFELELMGEDLEVADYFELIKGERNAFQNLWHQVGAATLS